MIAGFGSRDKKSSPVGEIRWRYGPEKRRGNSGGNYVYSGRLIFRTDE